MAGSQGLLCIFQIAYRLKTAYEKIALIILIVAKMFFMHYLLGTNVTIKTQKGTRYCGQLHERFFMSCYKVVLLSLMLLAPIVAMASDDKEDAQEFNTKEFVTGLTLGVVAPGSVGGLGYMGAGLMASFGFDAPFALVFPNLFQLCYGASTVGAIYKYTEGKNKSKWAGWALGSLVPFACMMRLRYLINSGD